MKKLLALLAAIAALHAPAQGQTEVALGVRAGANFSNVTFGDPLANGETRSSRASFGGGLFADFIFSDPVSLRVGLDYAGMGGKVNSEKYDVTGRIGPEIFANADRTIRADYLSVPVQAVFGWNIAESKVRFNAGAGFYAAFLLRGEEDFSTNGYYRYEAGSVTGIEIPAGQYGLINESNDIKSLMNKMNFGVTGSIGLSYPVGQRGSVILEWGVSYGFSKLFKENNDSRTYGSRAMLGYRFKL